MKITTLEETLNCLQALTAMLHMSAQANKTTLDTAERNAINYKIKQLVNSLEPAYSATYKEVQLPFEAVTGSDFAKALTNDKIPNGTLSVTK